VVGLAELAVALVFEAVDLEFLPRQVLRFLFSSRVCGRVEGALTSRELQSGICRGRGEFSLEFASQFPVETSNCSDFYT
jgi:hypothetical protein